MNYTIQILDLEIELENIRERKKTSIKAMKYDLACEYRDLERLKEKEIFILITNIQKNLDEILSESNDIQILDLEIELETIRNRKNDSTKAMRYGVASEYRDLEKLKEDEILSLIKNLKKAPDEIQLAPDDYYKLKEMRRAIWYYQKIKNSTKA